MFSTFGWTVVTINLMVGILTGSVFDLVIGAGLALTMALTDF